MKNKILIILILLTTIFYIPVMAKSNNFNSGEHLELDKKIDATNFSAGNNVEISSEIDGANFVAGNNIALSSTQDILFTAGNSININNITTKDAFIAGSLINIQQSNIRDLYAVAETIRIDSNISRNAYLGGENITINAKIDGDVEIAAENIRIGKEAEIKGTIHYPKDSKISIANTAKIGKQKTYKTKNVNVKKTIQSKIIDGVYSLLSMLLIGIILISLNKKTFKKIAKLEKDASIIIKTTAIGLLTLIIVPIISILVMITVIGLPLSLITLIIYILLIYLSSIPTAYYLSTLLGDKIKNKYIAFSLVLLIIYIIKLIPPLQGLINFLTICLGMGIYAYLIKQNIKEK